MTSEAEKPGEVVRDADSSEQAVNASEVQQTPAVPGTVDVPAEPTDKRADDRAPSSLSAALSSAATPGGSASDSSTPKGQRRFDPSQPFARRQPLPAKPRRVRGGVKLSRAELDYHDSPTAARWLEVALATIKPAMHDEALEYARSGQAKRLELGSGRVVAPIQGRMPGAYTTSVEFDALSAKQWDTVVQAMGTQAKFAATLIAGHLTADLLKLFESLDSSLVPGAIRPSCTCAERREAYEASNPGAVPATPVPAVDKSGWCKHSVCLALLVADRLASEPLAILQLRGMRALQVMDRLHEIRTAQTQPGPPMPVYTPVVKGASDVTYPPLESFLSDFWSSPIDPRELDFPVVKPEVSHPLLRRLGPSPFQDGKFPLVGILASCYDSISEAILREELGGRSDDFDEMDELDEPEGELEEGLGDEYDDDED